MPVSCQGFGLFVCVKPPLSLVRVAKLLPLPPSPSLLPCSKFPVTGMIDDQVLRMKASMKNDSTRVKKKTESLLISRSPRSSPSASPPRVPCVRDSDERKRNFIFSTSSCVCLCCQGLAGEEERTGQEKKSDEDEEQEEEDGKA